MAETKTGNQVDRSGDQAGPDEHVVQEFEGFPGPAPAFGQNELVL
jgi:hypothetical protein